MQGVYLVGTLGHVCGKTPSLQADKVSTPPDRAEMQEKSFFW